MWNIYGKSVARTFLGAFFGGAHIVQTIPKYIWMWHCQFGIDKCTMLGMKKGEIMKSDGIQLLNDKVINSLEKREKAISIYVC